MEKLLSPLYWTDVNLSGIAYSARSGACVALTRHSPTDPRPPFDVAVGEWTDGRGGCVESQRHFDVVRAAGSFTPVAVGDVIGPSWSTHWYRVHIAVPEGGERARGRTRWSLNPFPHPA